MQGRALALGDPVGAVGIGHVVEGLAELDEAVDEALGALDVDVVVAGAVDDEQVPGQPSAWKRGDPARYPSSFSPGRPMYRSW